LVSLFGRLVKEPRIEKGAADRFCIVFRDTAGTDNVVPLANLSRHIFHDFLSFLFFQEKTGMLIRDPVR
jgi:hypothetical protein